jgi:chitinase
MKNAYLILIILATLALGQRPEVNYPVRFTYINTISSWASQSAILAGLGVPGYAKAHSYNYIAFAFWSYSGPLDMAKVWADPVKYIGTSADLGSTKDQMQKAIKKKYNDAGISVFVSAFGATEMPTGQDPTTVATSLANWVLGNNLDGVDIDYEDNDAMSGATAEKWLITFQKKLRELLPNHLITHAPQAPYFSTTQYRGGGYITVDKQVGSTIDFYNVQFYNQGGTTYDSYDTLFKVSNGWSTGTAVKQIISQGIPSEKIVVGKPATQSDASNSGTVSTTDLGNWCVKAYNEFGWYAGVMFWQYKSDS